MITQTSQRRNAGLGMIGMALSAATPAQGASPAPAFEVTEASIADIDAALASGRVTSRQLVQAYLERITAYDQAGPALNAIVRINPAALDEADALDRERAVQGPRGPLHGVPLLVKDNYDTADMPTSGGTLALATLQPAADAVQVARLRAAGAIILGKTTMHELASGITTVSSLTGYSRNPYDPTRSPGGSSGGTGAAVAASFAAAGMGSDTCGSIRIPSAYQNLVGLRAASGLASGKGIMPLSSTQDVGGPLARTVGDLALMLDATVEPGRKGFADQLEPGALKGARIGLLRSMFGTSPDDKEGQDVVDHALARMREAGAVLSEAEIPGLDALVKDSSLVPHEFRYDFAAYLAAQPHPPVSSIDDILAGGLAHEALDARLRLRAAARTRDPKAYAEVLEKRRALREAVLRVMAEQKLDALLYPTSLRRPPVIGTEDLVLVNSCQFSATADLPAIAIPAGFTADGSPIGIELLGGERSEQALVRLAYDWEQVTKPRKAPFSTPPLVKGKAPPKLTFTVSGSAASGTRTRVTFHYDPMTAQLSAQAHITGVKAEDVVALTIQHSRDGGPGPVLAPLLRLGQASGTATLTLSAPDRADLFAGRLYTMLYTRSAPLGEAKAVIKME